MQWGLPTERGGELSTTFCWCKDFVLLMLFTLLTQHVLHLQCLFFF